MNNFLRKILELLTALGPGHVADSGKLEGLLAACWDGFDGSDEGGMEAHKLLGRMEDATWTPLVLTFTVERHGGTVCGSTRAELQHWAVDLDAKTATITKIGHRQLKPLAARVSIKSIAEEVAQATLDGKDDDRLLWLDKNTAKVQATLIFPTGSGFKRTVEGRWKTLCRYVEQIVTGQGWAKKSWNVFAKNLEPPQPEEKAASTSSTAFEPPSASG